MGKEYIPLFLDFNESTQDLSDEECGRLIRAIVDYANAEDYEKRLTGAERIAFRFLKGIVDRNAAISEARSKAGANRNKPEQTETKDSKPEQTETNSPTKKENKKENKNQNQNKEQQARFDRFWEAYPRKEAKPRARSEFDKIAPDDDLLAKMLAAIDRWKRSAQWREDGGKYIPHPATWIHQKRWEDDPPKESPGKLTAQQYDQRDYSGDDDFTGVMQILQGDMRA